MSVQELKEEFKRKYNSKPDHIFFCPGRVNLIGEHIDYNGGQVMPCAISKGTYFAVSKNTEKLLRFHCLNFPESVTLHLQSSYTKTGKEWFNYPLGAINEVISDGHDLSGLDMLFYGDLPIGSGLSSSASIEVLTVFALSELFGLGLDKKEIAIRSKKVENEFIGVNCGIMDQFAVAKGQKDKAILLNCDTIEYEYLPFNTGDYVLAVVNSRKQRTLADSKYNERFAECGRALKLLRQELPVNHLCDISMASFELKRHLITEEVLVKRAEHVISENQRVKDAVVALQIGDLEVFGQLMYASHYSLKELYEVSGKELDAIVDFCKDFDGCIGARMTGAGFGGCAIALIHKSKTAIFATALTEFYTTAIGYAPEIFTSLAEEGVREITV